MKIKEAIDILNKLSLHPNVVFSQEMKISDAQDLLKVYEAVQTLVDEIDEYIQGKDCCE